MPNQKIKNAQSKAVDVISKSLANLDEEELNVEIALKDLSDRKQQIHRERIAFRRAHDAVLGKSVKEDLLLEGEKEIIKPKSIKSNSTKKDNTKPIVATLVPLPRAGTKTSAIYNSLSTTEFESPTVIFKRAFIIHPTTIISDKNIKFITAILSQLHSKGLIERIKGRGVVQKLSWHYRKLNNTI